MLTGYEAKWIEDVDPGDRVWSRDEFDPAGPGELKEVEEVFARFAQVLHLRVGSVTIGTTAEHPFWVVGRGWTDARDLVPGDRLVGLDGQEAVDLESLPLTNHMLELQLGGADAIFNMMPLLLSVNKSVGSQLQKALARIPMGGVVSRVTFN